MDSRGDAKSREMMLDELLGYDHVTIQCHDNPDADAIASGYGLYCFFRDKGKDTRLLYSGRNKVRKANLMRWWRNCTFRWSTSLRWKIQ